MDNYGFRELNKIRLEANYRFYKDAYTYYFNLLFMPFETKEMRSCLLNIIKLYRNYSMVETNTINLIKSKYGNDNTLKEIEDLLTEINNYYEVIYFYFEKFLVIYDDLINTKNPSRFHLPKEDLDLSFYFNIQKRLKIKH